MDYTNPTISKSTEEIEAEMFSLVVGFAMRMPKRAANAQGVTTLSSEGLYGKRFK